MGGALVGKEAVSRLDDFASSISYIWCFPLPCCPDTYKPTFEGFLLSLMSLRFRNLLVLAFSLCVMDNEDFLLRLLFLLL